MSRVRVAVFLVGAMVTVSTGASQGFKLPPEVTPALRAACESDVRRLCIGDNPTVSSVKACVIRRYGELSMRCKVQIAAAGLTPSRRPPF